MSPRSAVSEQILNGTSAQLGYTVPFTLVHAGKYRTEDKFKDRQMQKLNTTQKSKHKTQQNKTTLVLMPLNQEMRWAAELTHPEDHVSV